MDGESSCDYEQESTYETYEDQSEPDESLLDVYQLCIEPSVMGTVEYVVPLLIITYLFNLSTRYIKRANLRHGISTFFGVLVLHYYVPESLIVIIIFSSLSYLIISRTQSSSTSLTTFLPSLLIVLFCEFSMSAATWHKIRGVMMIIVMKIVSVTLDSFDPTQRPLINIYSYLGYIFCPATCFFGPWVAFKDYLSVSTTTKKWIPSFLTHFVICLAFLVCSNCLVSFILKDSYVGNYVWIVAYRDALAFRTSHYFISFMSASVIILGGFDPVNFSTVTRPLEIELPRSLVQVVINWNVPMHFWLKTYVFRPARRQLGRFGAILTTYAASSLLHGLNFQLSAVLLSLGFYTYIEFQLRLLLSEVFDACVGSKSCPPNKCNHSRKQNCAWVVIINLGFSFLSVFHLAYLGLMFDTSELQETGYSYSHTIDKWSQLGFASHWLAFITYCAYFLIR